MSQKKQPSVREVIMKKVEGLGEEKTKIQASDLPPQAKERKIEVIDSELERLAKAYNSLLRN